MSESLETQISDVIRLHRGKGTVAVETLEAVLAEAKDSELISHEREIERQRTQARLDVSVKSYEHSVEVGQTAIRQSFLLNGGAGAALLAYLGQMISAGKEPGLLMIALAAWALGAFAATCANGFSFLAQSRYTEAAVNPETNKTHELQGDRWRVGATCCVITALIGFATGCLVAGGGLLGAW
ncbi:MAG: hypothetical protein AAGH74_03165 [Pseudomonadota bacterium]